MKIVELRAVDEEGVEHRWEGTGFLQVASVNAHPGVYQRRAVATILLPPEPEVK